MRHALLLRLKTGDQGTFGLLKSEGFSVFTVELPWLDNSRSISCIPAGSYQCKWKKSTRFGWCYEVLNVPQRGNILFHKGNYAGNISKGYKTNSNGCILLAKKLGTLAGQQAGLLSAPAIHDFHTSLATQPFILEIVNAYSNPSPSQL